MIQVGFIKNIDFKMTKEERREYNKEHYKKNKGKVNERSREYRQNNKDKIKEWHKEHYIKNKDRIAERSREYRQNNKDKIKERSRSYHNKNKDKIKEYQKQYAQSGKSKIARSKYYQNNKYKILKKNKKWHNKNKDKIKGYQKQYTESEKFKIWQSKYFQENKGKVAERAREYRQNNKDKIKEYHKTKKYRVSITNTRHKRRARTKQTDITTKYLLELKSKTSHCEICGKKLKDNIHLDHIIPLNVGGLHIKSNIRYVHAKCNLQRPKNGSDIIQFRLL